MRSVPEHLAVLKQQNLRRFVLNTGMPCDFLRKRPLFDDLHSPIFGAALLFRKFRKMPPRPRRGQACGRMLEQKHRPVMAILQQLFEVLQGLAGVEHVASSHFFDWCMGKITVATV